MTLGMGLLAALGSALALNWGYWVQHGAAATMPPLSLRRPVASLLLLFTDRRWTIGFLVGIGGWVLYVGALKLAALSLVQSVSAGGIGVLALLAWRLGSARPSRRELVSLALALLGLVVLAASLANGSPSGDRASASSIALWIGVSVLLAGVIVLAGGRGLRAGAGFGIAAGLLYASGDVATKAAVGGGARIVFVAALLACHGAAFVVLQLGFQRGGVLATAGLASLFTNAVPIVAGIALFGEGLPGGWMGAARVFAFAAVVVGGAGLARGEPAAARSPGAVDDPSAAGLRSARVCS